MGGQMQAVAPPFRVHPAAPLRDEIDGVHLDQFAAFLSCLKLATSYVFGSTEEYKMTISLNLREMLWPGPWLWHATHVARRRWGHEAGIPGSSRGDGTGEGWQ